MKVYSIAAMDEGRLIGKDNSLPWHIPTDMKRFMSLTKGHTVLMGRKTFESLPPLTKPLPDRKNIVITRDASKLSDRDDIDVYTDPSECIQSCRDGSIKLPSDILWVIGGSQIYTVTLPLIDEIYLTLVKGVHEGDAYFPKFEEDFSLEETEEHDGFSFLRYIRN